MPIFGLGTTEIIIILVILLILFGGKKLPELARSIGESFKELKSAVNEPEKDKKEKKE